MTATLTAAPSARLPTLRPNAVVAVDGSGTQTTIQAAIDAAPAGGQTPYLIEIRPGTYHEHVLIPADKPYVTLRGDPGQLEHTIVTMGTNVGSVGKDGRKLSTPESATVLVRAANFTAEDVTFENTTTLQQKIQALAIYITGDRAILRHCRFLGWQDTVRADAPRGQVARQYFVDCTIEGYVDFIYAAGTAVFDHCHIHCRGDGYITAASTASNVPLGYVFLDCRVTAAPEVHRTYLGRPWRPYAAVAFLRTELPAQIAPAGWDNWGNVANERTARFAEYASHGPGARPAARAPWARQLTDAEAARYTVPAILGGRDGWNPQASAGSTP